VNALPDDLIASPFLDRDVPFHACLFLIGAQFSQ
jgi:hypothetical protein